MKKITALFLSLLTVLIIGYQVAAQDLVPYLYTFTGRWQPAEDPLLIDDFGFQDIQNVRKDGKHFKGVNGHTAINTSAPSTDNTAFPVILNGFHFRKDQPAESHVIIYAADTMTPTAGRLFHSTTDPPGTGNFSTTALWSPYAFNDIWRFSPAPAGNMVAANGDETLIWGGDEIEATSIITSSSTITYSVTNSNDYSEILSNSRQTPDQTAVFAAGGLEYPPAHTDTYVKATSEYDYNYHPYYATDPAKSLIGVGVGQSWASVTGGTTNQRFHVDLGTAKVITNVYYENFHVSGSGSGGAGFDRTSGVKNFTLWGSNTAGAFANLTYGTDTDWTQLTTSQSTFDEHSAADAPDPKYISVTNTTAYRYYAFKFADNYGNAVAMGVRRITLMTAGGTNASNRFLVGSKRPLQGVKFYVATGNPITSTLTAKEWNGTTWETLSSTDNTASGGKTLYQTGTVTWPSTVNTSKPRYINGLSLYWYQFEFDAGAASLYYVTVNAPIQPLKNIWNGVEEYAAKCLKYDGTTYKDYTNDVNDGSQSTYADFSSLAAAHSIYLGFLNPQQAINFNFVAGAENSTTSTQMSVYRWNGSDWRSVEGLNNATTSETATTTSFSKGGVVSFQGATKGQEFKRAISDEYPLYYYKVQFANALDASVHVSEITGIAYPDESSQYKFSQTFQNRLFLCNDKSGNKNKCIYSTYNAPDLMNGEDSGEITFGDRQDLTAAAVIYNIYTNTAVESFIVTKRNETYRLSGSAPSSWVLQKMSSNIGCVAPLSMVSAEMTESADVKRTVAIWQSDKGIVMSDGATIVPISDDIKCYFDPNDARHIPAAWLSKSVAWYDPSTRSYKITIASGAASTYLNTELEYSLRSKEWTKVYRENASGANPLQSGFQVWDSSGSGYTYGGGKDGFIYRLENGNNWNGVANITAYLHTKDMILDSQAPMMRKSTIKYLRTAYKKKGIGNVTITHYGNRAATTSGTNGQVGPAIITNASTTHYDTQSTILGPWLYHSLKYSTTTNVADGMELLSTGIYYQPQTTIRQ
jgi:hypothetical protein